MTTLDSSQITNQQLEEIKKKLSQQKEALGEELKTKYKTIYDWLVENYIDFDNLAKYSQNISAALVMTVNQANSSLPAKINIPTTNPQSTKQVTRSTEDSKLHEKAKHFWEIYGNIINAISQKYGVDPQLIFATIMTESGGNPNAYRFEPRIGDASYGLGQILYGTALGLGFRGRPTDMYQPIISIDLVARYHKRTIEMYGDLTPEQMSIVYNTGSLFKKPHSQHLMRFRTWYAAYPVKKELASDQKIKVK